MTYVIQQYVPECILISSMETQLVYKLSTEKKSQFSLLFAALDFQKQNLKLNSFKITDQTRVDIYRK